MDHPVMVTGLEMAEFAQGVLLRMGVPSDRIDVSQLAALKHSYDKRRTLLRFTEDRETGRITVDLQP